MNLAHHPCRSFILAAGLSLVLGACGEGAPPGLTCQSGGCSPASPPSSPASPGSPNSIAGTVGGEGFVARQAALVTGTDTAGNLVALGVLLSDQSNLCSQLQQLSAPTGNTLLLVLTSTGSAGSSIAPTPGEYRVESGGGFAAHAELRRTFGNASSSFAAKAGTVKLSTLRSGSDAFAAGTFDLTLGESLDKVSGTFAAPLCSGVTDPIRLMAVGPCHGRSRCQADRPATPQEIAQCEAQTRPGFHCATEYVAVLVCAQSQQRCTADQRTDGTALAASCKGALDSYVRCNSQ